MFVWFRYVDDDGVTTNQVGRQVSSVPRVDEYVRLDRDGPLFGVLSIERVCTERTRNQRVVVRLAHVTRSLSLDVEMRGASAHHFAEMPGLEPR